MRARLLCLLVATSALACGRTEPLGIDGDTSGSPITQTTEGTSGASGSTVSASSSGAASTTSTSSGSSGRSSSSGTTLTTGSSGANGTTTGTTTTSSTSGTTATTGSTGRTVGSTGSSAGTTGAASGSTTGTLGSSGGFTTGSTSGTSGASTGSSGATTGTTGSTGSTTGGGDCRNLGCPSGESCQPFTSRSGSYWACACSPATRSRPDSCAQNTDGKTVCDDNTLQCRYPRDYDPCNASDGGPVCAPGYVCVPGPGGTGYCQQSCQRTTDCTTTYTHCVVGAGGTGLCQIDYCGGATRNGDYYRACNQAASNDGFCQPLPDGNGGLVGICFSAGPAQTGQACPGFGVDRAATCAAGDLCLPDGNVLPDGGSDARCYATCNVDPRPGTYHRTCSGLSICWPDSFSFTQPDPGICYP